jgi:hypothetical protein
MVNIRDSSVGIVTRLDEQGVGVRFPVGANVFSILRNVQTGSGAHSASCVMGTGGSFSGSKATGALIRPFAFI